MLDCCSIGLPLSFLTVCLIGGCAEDDVEIQAICEYINDPDECPGPEGETGGDPIEKPDNAAPTCSLGNDGHTRKVFQCNGELSASIAFNTIMGNCAKTLGDPGWCNESHSFGEFESDHYEMPAVMACCDMTEPFETDTYLTYCASDMVEQFCRSIPMRLKLLIDEDVIDIGKKQAKNLHNWLNDHQQDCYNAFNQQADVPGLIEPTSWLVNGGNNKGWLMLKDFTITLDSAAIDSVRLPLDEYEQPDCTDNDFNNTEFFEDDGPISPGINSVNHLSGAPDVSIAGPMRFGNRVTGIAVLSSEAVDCQDPWCSILEITEDPMSGLWTLEDLNLYADGPATLTSGKWSLPSDRSALRLYDVARGTIYVDANNAEFHVIQPNRAHFVISGASSQALDVRWASNTSPITARRSASGWRLEGFLVEHIDRDGQTWTLHIPPTRWN